MVQLGHTYDPNQHEPNSSFDPLPPAWYAAQIIDSDVKPTKNGAGQYLELVFEVLENVHPNYKGRRIWVRLNLWNQNQTAVDIANRDLSAICRSIGHMDAVEDSEVLHFRPLAIKVKVRPASGDYDATNDVSGYDAMATKFGQGAPVSQGTMSPPPQRPQPPAQPPQQGQPGQTPRPPWGQ